MGQKRQTQNKENKEKKRIKKSATIPLLLAVNHRLIFFYHIFLKEERKILFNLKIFYDIEMILFSK